MASRVSRPLLRRTVVTCAAAAPTPRPARICVVGGGVVGLTSALRLLQLNGDSSPPSTPAVPTSALPPTTPRRSRRRVEVIVVASEFGAETTTAGAAGLWGPYKLWDTPEELVCRWGGETYDYLMRLAHSAEADAAGVSLCTVNSFYPEQQPLPFWRHIPYSLHAMDPRMLDTVSRRRHPGQGQGRQAAGADGSGGGGGGAGGSGGGSGGGGPEPAPLPCEWGYQWSSVVCEGARYLPWLTQQVEALGGVLLRSPRLSSLQELAQLLPQLTAEAGGDTTCASASSSSGSGSATSTSASAGAPTLAATSGSPGASLVPDLGLGTGRGWGGGGIDAVVNAAGLGCRDLLGDGAVVPIRGQVLRVRAPWVRQAYFFDPFYVIPNRDSVVLGGTGQVGNFSREVCPADRAAILEGCTRLLPSLAHAQPLTDWVGLRPGRTRLRLELEPAGLRLGQGLGQGQGPPAGGGVAGTGAPSGSAGGTGGGERGREGREGSAGGEGGGAVPVVHNYGHGGAGLTLAWGCAGDVVELLAGAGVL